MYLFINILCIVSTPTCCSASAWRWCKCIKTCRSAYDI